MIGDNSDNYCHSLSKTLWTAKRDTLLSLPFNVCNVIEYLYSAFSVFIKSHSEALPLQLAARSASEALLAAMMPLDWKMISKIHWDGNNEFAALEKIWSWIPESGLLQDVFPTKRRQWWTEEAVVESPHNGRQNSQHGKIRRWIPMGWSSMRIIHRRVDSRRRTHQIWWWTLWQTKRQRPTENVQSDQKKADRANLPRNQWSRTWAQKPNAECWKLPRMATKSKHVGTCCGKRKSTGNGKCFIHRKSCYHLP